MIFYIDIDGILTKEIEGWDYKNRTPNLENIKFCIDLYEKNHIIVLYTSRYKRDKKITKKWLKKYKVKYHKIKFRKPKYDFFIDDKAFNKFKKEFLSVK
jgi:uncharacterized HAD superfamily protein